MAVDLTLLKMARGTIKRAFVAAGDPAMGGAPPAPGGDPAAMGGDPAAMGGAPPMDPAAMSGAPPMDPSMMGGMPPMPPPDPRIDQLMQMVQQMQGGAPSAPGAAGMAGKPAKPDINTVATDVFQLKKMFLHFLRIQNIELPPDILDGPNRDPQTGAPTASPTGGSSDVAAAPAGPSPAIQPIQPMQPAMGGDAAGMGGGGEPKTAGIGRAVHVPSLASRAQALAERLRARG